MAIPVTRMMVPHTRPSLRLSHPNSSRVNFLCHCAPSELQPLRPELSLSVGTHAIPHPDKVEKGGEDAFFVSSYRGGVMAVADGVSGWAEQNVDPSLISKELMANAPEFESPYALEVTKALTLITCNTLNAESVWKIKYIYLS